MGCSPPVNCAAPPGADVTNVDSGRGATAFRPMGVTAFWPKVTEVPKSSRGGGHRITIEGAMSNSGSRGTTNYSYSIVRIGANSGGISVVVVARARVVAWGSVWGSVDSVGMIAIVRLCWGCSEIMIHCVSL